MNLFKREVRANIVALAVWTIASCALLAISYWEYGLIEDPAQMAQLFSGFPDIINTLFGVSPLGINDVIGYSALIIYYITFIGVAYALVLGSKIIQKELDDKTSEFLFTKPITRNKVFTTKSAVGKINMLIFVGINFLCTLVLVLNQDIGEYSNHEVLKYLALTYFGLYILMLMTFFITIAASCVFAEKKYSLFVGGTFIMYSYATSVLTLGIEKFQDYTILSPWRYFAIDVIVTDGFNIIYLAICIVVILFATLIGYIAVNRKLF